MKKILMLLLTSIGLLLASCSMDDADYVSNIPNSKHASTNVTFNIIDESTTRAAGDPSDNKWPSDASKTNAETVVNMVYTTPKAEGISFFTSNYDVNLTNDKASNPITSWNGSTELSLTEKNTITVTLTPKVSGKHPKFAVATGTIDLSSIDLDSATPSFTSANYTGDIVIKNITNNDGKINVTIQVNLKYDSYLLVAPDASWSILTNVKGFNQLKWGGSSGVSFFTQSITGGTWFYYWGSGNDYVWGKGSLLQYGFNLYSDGSQSIHVSNGKWYALFASLNSAGEGDDNPGGDSSKTHEIGGSNGIEPTADDIVGGGAIR